MKTRNFDVLDKTCMETKFLHLSGFPYHPRKHERIAALELEPTGALSKFLGPDIQIICSLTVQIAQLGCRQIRDVTKLLT